MDVEYFDVKYQIFQPTLGSNRCLAPFETLDIGGGKTRFDFDFYNRTYVGEMTVKSTETIQEILETIYVKFNEENDCKFNYGYPDFKGHSLSVGDIIAIENEYFYCDIDGWSRNIRTECGYPEEN